MRAEITNNYLMSLSIEGKECHFDDGNGIYSWNKIANNIDMHIRLSHNETYNYYNMTIHEYIRGYHAGYSQLEADVKYIDELENALKIMGYEIK